MESKGSKVVAISGVILAVLVKCMVSQRVHVVGDGMGWHIPPGGDSDYANWASTKTFHVGDILTFNFMTNGHDVVRVPKTSFEECTTENAVQTIAAGPVNVSLAAAGDHFFICSLASHCTAGQKLSVSVSAAAAATISPSPAPEESSAPAVGLGGSLLCIAFVLLLSLIS